MAGAVKAGPGKLLPVEKEEIANRVVARLNAQKGRRKRKKKPAESVETVGRFTIWNLPWDADASVPFEFPAQAFAFRLLTVNVTIGPVGSVGLIVNLVIRDGAGNIVVKLCSPELTATIDDSAVTFSADLPFQAVPNGGVSPFCYVAALPSTIIILPSMRLELELGASSLAGVDVRGVCILTEALDFSFAPAPRP